MSSRKDEEVVADGCSVGCAPLVLGVLAVVTVRVIAAVAGVEFTQFQSMCVAGLGVAVAAWTAVGVWRR